MRKTILISYVALLISFAMAWFSCRSQSVSVYAAAEVSSTETPIIHASEPPSPAPAETAVPTPAPTAASAEIPTPDTVTVLHGGEVYERELQEYLTEVVAAEMPAGFEEEALRAQAVAARTYTLYCARTHRHGSADVCTDSGCCQAWTSRDALLESWGESFENNMARISEAVSSTAGEYLSYDGTPIFAAFHSSSGERTEASGDLWNALPYLISVESPENADTVPNYISCVEVSPLDFRDTVLHEVSTADFTGDASAWIGEIVRDESGRVSYAVLGGAELSGARLRTLFSLRSTDFELEYTSGRFLFTVTGFGHGVGMSQYGANTMAASGADYREILSHYYPGTMLVR